MKHLFTDMFKGAMESPQEGKKNHTQQKTYIQSKQAERTKKIN